MAQLGRSGTAKPASVSSPNGPTPGGERALAALAYWGPFVLVPMFKRKKSRFVLFHTRQALYFLATTVVVMGLTVGALVVIDRTSGQKSGMFLFFSVILTLELVLYTAALVILTLAAARSRMPMIPVLGDLAGEG